MRTDCARTTPVSWRPKWGWLMFVLFLGAAAPARAQIDPEKRRLFQFGYNQPLQGRGPLSGYAFYYFNEPEFIETNLTLRLAIAPVYVDSELGIRHALSPNTDLAIGLAGGGFADTYSEIRQGKYLREESFTGHGGGVVASVYHLFNPGQRVPLNGMVRAEFHQSVYSRDKETAPNFVLPEDQPSFNFRTGLRWGGKEPLIFPEVAMEISAWYESMYRLDPSTYGFGDRQVNDLSHLFWGRALLAYPFPKLRHSFRSDEHTFDLQSR